MKKGSVFVGLSGGVDSSVTAALLKNEGYKVTGVFIKVWYPDFLKCSWREDQLDAMRVCAKLEIPFHTLDLSHVYRKEVVEAMIEEYRRGRTPNPDVMCNTHIKFGAFLTEARRQGADFIATGHYVERRKLLDKYHLYTAADTGKDQSYFLWGLGQNELAYTLFPIGNLQKKKVRAMAATYGLITAGKKDSQGLCFLGKLDMKEFLSHYIEAKSGKVLDEKGNVVGQHDGAFFYTLGQRHGFHVTTAEEQKPHYVVSKNLEQNTIAVATDLVLETKKRAGEIELEHVHWVLGVPPENNDSLLARVRYRQPLLPCKLSLDTEGNASVSFLEKSTFASPGQSLVLYRRSEGEYELLGGGVIS